MERRCDGNGHGLPLCPGVVSQPLLWWELETVRVGTIVGNTDATSFPFPKWTCVGEITFGDTRTLGCYRWGVSYFPTHQVWSI